ncbi:MAG: FAD-linked oxidase C-terminal domain-containing protein [Phycisphaerales bacterium]|nr:FAD-linked oxidase C-terminal domain-containing protein [Phycisphaerales bacterium]
MSNEQIEQGFIDQVSQQCGLDIRVDSHARGLYSTDASIYQVAPIGVVVPQSTEQISTLLKLCFDYKIPVLPRGGGTSLAGQGVNRALIIDLSESCHQLVSFNKCSSRVLVEAGMTIDDLNDRVIDQGLFFAPDPSTARQANIGGCIGNNAAGVHSVLYGRTSDHVLAIDACLADGSCVRFEKGASLKDDLVQRITHQVVDVIKEYSVQIRERFPRTARRSSGYQLDVILDQLESSGWDPDEVNLAPLLCGSEGTLAVTTRALLNLVPIPIKKGLAVLAFESLDDAIESVESILRLNPSGVELLDDLIMDLARANTEYARYVSLLPSSQAKAVLFVEFFADSQYEIDRKFDELELSLPSIPMQRCSDATEIANAWKLRKAGEPLLHAIAGNRKPLGFVEDNAVPVSKLPEFVCRFRSIVESEGTIASYYAHASVGVLHVRPLLDLRDINDEQAMHRIASSVAQLAQELGGVPSGEHGDGRARGPFIESYFGSDLLKAFRKIKSIFDPMNLLNPGNIVSPGSLESISEQTRVKPNNEVVNIPEVDTYFEYQNEQGFGHAVEMCNGAGVCRRKQGGVMCPSYQATLEERHSTRGRGNALRLAMSGQIDLTKDQSGAPVFNDPSTLETLGLCLSCKGCKTECPSSVDISKLKSEYLAQGYREIGKVPFNSRVMSNIHILNRLGTVFPGLSNVISEFSPVRSIINHALDIHPKRSLPKLRSRIKPKRLGSSAKPKVLIVSDTFSTHNDPSVVYASRDVLERFGYEVGIETVSDLGRASISFGNLEFAQREARRVLSQLTRYINDDQIIGLLIPEPSCLSVVHDEWKDLRIECDKEMIDQLIKKSALPETFIETRWEHHPTRPEFREIKGELVLHGHCHQKSLWGVSTSSSIFERLYPNQTRVLNTGCCGMAGAFGYGKDRYDLSMKIGEQSLFPAVRESSNEDIIVATGTSCRHQILDGTQRVAIHPIEAIHRLSIP